MHIRRVHAFRQLQANTGLITYQSYSKPEGYVLTTRAHQPRDLGSQEVAPYVAGMLDLYCSLRPDLDTVAGEGVLSNFDDLYLDQLIACERAVLPPE